MINVLVTPVLPIHESTTISDISVCEPEMNLQKKKTQIFCLIRRDKKKSVISEHLMKTIFFLFYKLQQMIEYNENGIQKTNDKFN